MRKVILLCLVAALLVGCSAVPELPVTTESATTNPPTEGNVPPMTMALIPMVGQLPNGCWFDSGNASDHSDWAGPSQNITNFHAGATAAADLLIHNGESVPLTCTVSAEYPPLVADLYARVLPDMLSWVDIPDTLPTIPPGQTLHMPLSITMPSDATAPKKFMVIFVVTPQIGWVQFGRGVEWIVTMRD